MSAAYSDIKSFTKNGLAAFTRFLNESNAIEHIKGIDYSKKQYQTIDKGHFGALILSQQAATKQEQLSSKMIRKWQALLTKEQLITGEGIEDDEIGVMRGPNLKKNVRIGSHIPPTWDKVPMYIGNLINDVNRILKNQSKLQDDDSYCKFLGESFQRFEAIHPFGDGNGRTGRLLANYIATFCNRPIMIFDSDYAKCNRYYEAHKSKKAMCCFMAKKIQEVIFGVDGQRMTISKGPFNSTAHYAAENGTKEIYEWHKLDTSVRQWKNEIKQKQIMKKNKIIT